MWDSRHLTTLWASTACYRDSLPFTFPLTMTPTTQRNAVSATGNIIKQTMTKCYSHVHVHGVHTTRCISTELLVTRERATYVQRSFSSPRHVAMNQDNGHQRLKGPEQSNTSLTCSTSEPSGHCLNNTQSTFRALNEQYGVIYQNAVRFITIGVRTSNPTVFAYGEATHHTVTTCFHAGILLGLLHPEDGSDVPPKRRKTFNGLHGVIFRKIVLFSIVIRLRG
jgi:hypothetical protein